MTDHRTCRHPDRDEPKLVCGYPLPCPWHTVTVDMQATPPTVTVPVTSDAMRPLQRLGDVVDALYTPRTTDDARRACGLPVAR